MRQLIFVVSLLVSFSSAVLASCLEEVSIFAEKICGQIQTSGSRQLTEANGQLKAEVSGIVRKVLGNASGDINAKHLSDTYENVLRKDLANELFNIRECRVKMVEVGRAEACKSMAARPASSTFSMEGGTTRFITPDDVILSMLGTPCGGNSNFVCILVAGVRHNLTLGNQVDIIHSNGQCQLTLIEIVKGRNTAQFHLRC